MNLDSYMIANVEGNRDLTSIKDSFNEPLIFRKIDATENFVSSSVGQYNKKRYETDFFNTPTLQEIYETLTDNVIGIWDDKGAVCDTQTGYRIPMSRSRGKEYLIESAEHNSSDEFINESYVSIKNWSRDLVRQVNNPTNNGRSYCQVICGKVGSGKSSFLDFALKRLKETFENEGIIVSRVNYEPSVMTEVHEDGFWIKYFRNEVYVGLLTYLCNSFKWRKKFFTAALEILDADNSSLIKKLFELETKDVEASLLVENLSKRTDIEELNDILSFMQRKLGLKYLVVFDGFDNFTLESITDGNQQEAFKAITQICINPLPYIKIDIRTLMTLRNCTHAYFEMNITERENRAKNRHVNRKLLPVGLDAIYNRIASILCKKYKKKKYIKQDKELVYRAVISIVERIKDAFGLHDDEQIVHLCNHNYRRVTAFLLAIFGHLFFRIKNLYSTSDKIESFDSIMKKFCSQQFLEDELSIHIIHEIFILGDTSKFENYYQSASGGELKIKEKEGFSKGTQFSGGGYIDNIFNYSLSPKNSEQIPYLLIKIRILQIILTNSHNETIKELNSTDSATHKSQKDIDEYLQKLGYFLPDDALEFTLKMMIMSGWLRVRFRDGHLKYNITRLGEFVVLSFCTEMRYLENIIQRTKLPRNIAMMMWGGGKYMSSGKISSTEAQAKWLFHSIINLKIFISYIRTIEIRESDKVKASGDEKLMTWYSDWCLHEKMKNHISESVLGVLSTWGTRRGLSINLDALNRELKKLNTQ